MAERDARRPVGRREKTYVEQSELDLRELWVMLRRRLWIVLLIPLVAGVTAGFVSLYVLKPVYSASTTLWVIKEGTAAQITLSDVQLSRNLTKTYAEVAKSRAVMAEAMSLLMRTDITVQQLQARLKVTPVRDTEILSFTVEDGDPVMAARIADAVATAFKAQIRQIMKVENVAVVDLAMIPTQPIAPRPVRNVALALVVGIMGALGLAVLLEYLDTSIKSPDDVARHIGLPVLGLIPVIDTRLDESSSRRRKTRTKTAQMVVEK